MIALKFLRGGTGVSQWWHWSPTTVGLECHRGGTKQSPLRQVLLILAVFQNKGCNPHGLQPFAYSQEL